MTVRKTNPQIFVIEREFAYSPELVFFALTNAEAKKVWFAGPPGWVSGPSSFDFSVGGREVSSGGPVGGPMHIYDSHFLEIIPNERLINAFTMHEDETILTASLAVTELAAGGKGTKLKFTEQITFLDGHDHLPGRIEGTEAMFDLLSGYMDAQYGVPKGAKTDA